MPATGNPYAALSSMIDEEIHRDQFKELPFWRLPIAASVRHLFKVPRQRTHDYKVSSMMNYMQWVLLEMDVDLAAMINRPEDRVAQMWEFKASQGMADERYSKYMY